MGTEIQQKVQKRKVKIMDAATLSLFGALIAFGVFLSWLNKSTGSRVLKVITYFCIIGSVLACVYLIVVAFLAIV